jgi:hypothetical protein
LHVIICSDTITIFLIPALSLELIDVSSQVIDHGDKFDIVVHGL